MGLILRYLCLLAFFSPLARAEIPDHRYVYLKGSFGVFLPIDGNQSSQINYGVGLGFRTSKELSFGAFFLRSAQKLGISSDNPVTNTVENMIFGPEMDYHFNQLDTLSGLILGIKAGFYYRNTSSQSVTLGLPISQSVTTWDIIAGPKIGYEYTFDFGLSLGGEFHVFYDFSDSTVVPMSFFLTLQSWF